MDPRIQEYVNTTLEAARKLDAAIRAEDEAKKLAPVPPPKPKFKMWDWFVNPNRPSDLLEIVLAGLAGGRPSYKIRMHPDPEGVRYGTMSEQQLSEWLSIPRGLDPPDGIRLMGEVRVPEEGEGWLGPSSGEYLAWSPTCQPNKDIHGGRRWIAERVEKHWQDAYKTCPKCREAVEVPEADSVMFECGAWQRRDGVFVPSVQCLQNQIDQLKAAKENPHG